MPNGLSIRPDSPPRSRWSNGVMISEASASAPAHPRMRHVTTAGSALAVALVPLVVGVLLAKALAADPMTPVNALIAGGAQRASLPRGEWSRRGRSTVHRLRTARRCAPFRGGPSGQRPYWRRHRPTMDGGTAPFEAVHTASPPGAGTGRRTGW